jgi:hypothetical protein
MSYKTDGKPHLVSKQTKAPKFSFYLVTVMVYYLREGVLKERHINMLSQLDVAAPFNKSHLSSLNLKAIARVTTENNVAVNDIKDVVFLNMNPLGVMTEEEFQGSAPVPVDPATV